MKTFILIILGAFAALYIYQNANPPAPKTADSAEPALEVASAESVTPEVKEEAVEELEMDARIVHYEAEVPETVEAAKDLLTTRSERIGILLKNEPLETQHLEAVHEHTYTLEQAVDKLRAEKAYTRLNQIDNLDEAVQALHYASENHEAERSREWFTKLQTALGELE